MTDGRKDDSGKLQWWLLPLAPVREIIGVMQWAAFDKQPKPYGPYNWQKVPNARQRYYDAAQRHLTAWWERVEANDPSRVDAESGRHILAHVGCCVLFLLWFELTEPKRTRTREASWSDEVRAMHVLAEQVVKDLGIHFTGTGTTFGVLNTISFESVDGRYQTSLIVNKPEHQTGSFVYKAMREITAKWGTPDEHP